MVVPEEIKNFLVIEDCSNFPIDRYVCTKSESQIAKDIVKMRKVVPKLKEMNIDYLNATLLYGDPGTGKAQPLDASVLTIDGFKKMGEIKEGDKVATPSGGFAEVASIYPQGEMDIYEVTFDDNSKTRCTADHLWEVTNPEGEKQIVTLSEIIDDIANDPTRRARYSIRGISPPAHKKKEFRISPEEYAKALALDIVTVRHEYLTGSIHQRTRFLNSYIRHAGKKEVHRQGERFIHLNETEHDTAEFIVNMARSLGFIAIIKRPEDNEGPGYDIRITRGDGRRHLKAIEKKGKGECQCIYIKDPEHLYITDDYIPTHNTTFGRYMAYKLGLEFAFIQFANIMSGSMGDTSKNITKIFDFIKDKKCIFMMDEIDAISAKRGYDTSSGGELSRITITVMQELDKLKRQGTGTIIIAATNIPTSNMDEALVSRFPIVKKIRTWTNMEKAAYIHKFLASSDLPELNEDSIQRYVSQNSSLPQRGIEADIIRAAAEWIANGQKEFKLEHIREKDLD